MLVFLIIACVFSAIKLEKRAEQVLPGREVRWGREEGDGGTGGRNGPNNVCTCE
jgi:hypothetical protein